MAEVATPTGAVAWGESALRLERILLLMIYRIASYAPLRRSDRLTCGGMQEVESARL